MNKTKDMTVGSPTKTIFFFSVPVLLGTLFQQIYNMADTIIVGQFLGEDALAAVGATGSTVYLVIGFASGLTQGCGILVSQAFGGHRLNELKKVVGTALLLTVVFSVILTIPTVSFSRQILLALHHPFERTPLRTRISSRHLWRYPVYDGLQYCSQYPSLFG